MGLITPKDFLEEVEKLVKKHKNEITYMEAVSKLCSSNNIDIHVAASIIKSSPKMKAKIRIQ